MFLKISSNNTLLKEDCNTFSFSQNKVWIKGYFFYKENYYTGKIAASLIQSHFISKNLLEHIKDFNGIFTCLIISEKTKKIYIFNDRFGFHSLFIHRNNSELIISNNFWKVSDQMPKAEVNELAFEEMLHFRHVLGETTTIKNIFNTQPASFYSINFRNFPISLTRNEYWNLEYKPEKISPQKGESDIYKTLDSIIKKYKNKVFQDKNIGLNLTGGIDSRFLLGLIIQNQIKKERINCYTYGDKDCLDIKITEQITAQINIRHKAAVFESPFYSFFSVDTINELNQKTGHSNYYFQAYGVSKLNKDYKYIDYLLTGADGYSFGLFITNELLDIDTKDALIAYIIKKFATILPSETISQIQRKKSVNAIKEELIKKISSQINEDKSFISSYFSWILKHRIKNYILSIYDLMNENTKLLLPFYDYKFIDLMLKLPIELLKDQNAYVNAMNKFVFKDELLYLNQAAIEQRCFYKKENNFILKTVKPGILARILSKTLALPEKGSTFKIYETFKKHEDEVFRLINNVLINESVVFNNMEISKLIRINKRNESFFKYALPTILTCLQIENQIKNQRIEHRTK